MTTVDVLSTPAVRDAERSVARVHVAGRIGQVLFSTLMVVNDRRRFARPRLQWGLLALMTAESAWLVRRRLATGRFRDPLVIWTDTAFAAAGLVVCRAGLGGGGALWMKNLAIGAAHGVGGSPRRVQRMAATGILGAAAMWCGARARGRDAHLAGWMLGFNDALNWAGQEIAARIYSSAHVRYALLTERAGELTVARAREAAAAAERHRQHRLLHARTVEALREIVDSQDAATAGRVARREVSRLRSALRNRDPNRADLDAALRSACESARGRGVSVELVTSELTATVSSAAVVALRRATEMSLLAAHELDGARRAVVRSVDDATTVTVTVRHHGGGFTPGDGSVYDQRLAALTSTLDRVGGTAEEWSSPGRGVRVTLRVPLTASSAGDRSADHDLAFALLGDGRATSTEEAVRTGRTIVSGFLSYRFSGLATGLAAVATGRDRYRSRTAATALFATAAIESVWMARRLWRSGATDVKAPRVDAAVAIAAVLLERRNITAADRGTFVNWIPWSFAAPAVTGQAMGARRPSAVSIAAAGLIGLATSAVLSAGPTELAANLAAMTGLLAGAHLLAEQIRHDKQRLEAAQAHALEEGVRLSAEHERARQLRLLHDSALQTLEAVVSGRHVDPATMRSRALQEADRLQLELDDRPAAVTSIVAELEHVVRAHAGRGLHVDLHVGLVTDPAAPVAAALRDACNEALTNVAKHAGVSCATVRVETVRDGVQITVQDAGVGFDPTTDAGFGTTESIQRRLVDVGGRAELRSERARGTTVTLWVPG